MRQPPPFGKGRRAPVVLFKGRGMFRNNQKSPYRKIANCAMVIIVPRQATLLMTF